jgi:hypothetical protein
MDVGPEQKDREMARDRKTKGKGPTRKRAKGFSEELKSQCVGDVHSVPTQKAGTAGGLTRCSIG